MEDSPSQVNSLAWAVSAAVIIFSLYSLRIRLHVRSSREVSKISTQHNSHGINPHTTQILPCSISHSRLSPKKHKFKYPYLSVGIPVRSPTSNWLLSVDEKPWWRRAWLHVSPKDHLHHGRDGETLSENIDAYLKLQGLDPCDFPFIYLLTSPRFLNYAFKPASFWLLYTVGNKLTHVVAEVNNTFGERRMYLFKASPERDGEPFQEALPKDFHVSPFSSRKGSYMVSCSDPMTSDRISLAVALRSSRDQPKLTARWWSAGPAMNPAAASLLDSLWLLASWGPAILTTFPKIVLEALVLAQVHKLQVWYRPEPRETAIPRQPNADEVRLSSTFVQYLQDFFFDGSGRKYTVRAAPRHASNETLAGQGTYGLLHARITAPDENAQGLNLTVHAPQFYRQVNTCQKLSELLEMALLDPHVENRTAWSDDAEALVQTVKSIERSIAAASGQGSRSLPWPQKLLWSLYRRMLCAQPMPGVYPYPAIPALRGDVDGEHKSFEKRRLAIEPFLDGFVSQKFGIVSQLRYMSVALRVRWRTWLTGIIGGE